MACAGGGVEGDYNVYNAGKCAWNCGYLIANVDGVHAEGSGLNPPEGGRVD
jgi:hypothetical protein